MSGGGQSTALPGPIEDASCESETRLNCDPVDLPELHLGLGDGQGMSGVEDEEEMEEEDDEVNMES